jgi:hypothetical protein
MMAGFQVALSYVALQYLLDCAASIHHGVQLVWRGDKPADLPVQQAHAS